eukprot:TRINITY_DN2452_c0_g1_i1.p1 TRINITY_DN2452_c0_g1~~TRINITY_DN2452_c0_g1_i1.p1  ORF type:complete len:389 (-),score=109.28 TRINITY_DN2452_c0_g1_i1:938-2104(-)
MIINHFKELPGGVLLYLDPEFKQRPQFIGFDLDCTLIRKKGGSYVMAFDNIVSTIENIYNKGMGITIMSNQKNQTIDSLIEKVRFLKMHIQTPFVVFFAREDNFFRKPLVGMFNYLEKVNRKPIAPANFFYVGDAAGRKHVYGRKDDFAASDRHFAENIGCNFCTPEMLFVGGEVIQKENEYLDNARDNENTPSNRFAHCENKLAENSWIDFLLQDIDSNNCQWVIIAVGPPCSCKSTFFKKYLKERNFRRVNRDTEKKMSKCVNLMIEEIEQGNSVYIDNTNPSFESRYNFLKHVDEKIRTICIEFEMPIELIKHMDKIRAIKAQYPFNNLGSDVILRKPLPDVAWRSYFNNYEEPNENEFNCIYHFSFSPEFETENDRKLAEMWTV